MTGIVDMAPDDYFANPALSSSGAKLLLPPNVPAMFKFRKDNPEQRDAYDFGKAFHAQVLEDHSVTVRVVDAKTWRGKAAGAEQAEARAAGEVPVLIEDQHRINHMAAAVQAHPLASKMFNLDHGKTEQSAFYENHGIDWRCRFDYLPDSPNKRGVMLLPDLKSTDNASPTLFGNKAASFGYFLSGAAYADAIVNLGLAKQAVMLLVAVAKTPPYLVSVCQMHPDDIERGRSLARIASHTYKRCTDSGHWPGYTEDQPAMISAPVWWQREIDDIEETTPDTDQEQAA